MRKSRSTTRKRLLAAGFTASAVAAATLSGVSAAEAVGLTSLTPSLGPAGATVTAVKTTSYTGVAVGALFLVDSTTCPAAYPSTFSATVVAASSATKVDASTVTVGVPTTLTAGTGGVPKAHVICTYTGATTSALTTLVSDTTTYSVVPTSPIAPVSGPAGGNSVVTLTAAAAAPFLTNVTSPGVAFNAGFCPDAYNGTGNLPASAVTRNSATSVSATTPTTLLGTGPITSYNVCVYGSAVSSATLVGTGARTFDVTLPGLELSPAVGTSAGGNSITATAPSDFLLGIAAPGALFTTAAVCPSAYPATEAVYAAGPPVVHAVRKTANPARKVSNSRAAITVPPLALVNSLPTRYMACLYNGTVDNTSTVIATAYYQSTVVPTLGSVSPSAGSALGGDKIVVTGTGLPTAPGSITATLGGLPLAVTPVSPNAFTATTPMHSAEDGVPLIITTAAGSTKLSNAFSFLDTISALPNTGANTTSLDLSVKGVNFFSANFSVTSTDAHIYLVRGEYDPTLTVASGNKVGGPVAECTEVLVITDNELICKLDLRSRLDAAGATVTPVSTQARSVATTTTVTGSRYLSTSATFAYSDAGLPISGAGIPADTVITEVLSTTQAVMSKAATAGASVTVSVGGPLRSISNVGTTNSSAAITAPAGSFKASDIGLKVYGVTGVTDGTVIDGISPNGAGATLSAAATATSGGTPVTVSLFGAPVPNGTYNLTFVTNGSASANTADPNYSQSVVASSSTFAVAPF